MPTVPKRPGRNKTFTYNNYIYLNAFTVQHVAILCLKIIFRIKSIWLKKLHLLWNTEDTESPLGPSYQASELTDPDETLFCFRFNQYLPCIFAVFYILFASFYVFYI